jgi:hypothetical protein
MRRERRMNGKKGKKNPTDQEKRRAQTCKEGDGAKIPPEEDQGGEGHQEGDWEE